MSLRTGLIAAVVCACCAGMARGQSSSIYQDARRRQAQVEQNRNTSFVDGTPVPANPELEQASLFAVKTPPPNEFHVHDLLTVIVREQKDYRADSRLETDRDWEVETQIDEFFRFINGHLGAASFTDGVPNIDFSTKTKLDNEGDVERSDSLTFRIQAEVIDIQPNGRLVLQARKQITIDEDVQILTVTGIVRSQDIGADNTVLSSQVYDQRIVVDHRGPLRDASRRGWLVKLVDRFTPF